MKLKNLTKSVSIILMLLAMLFSCQPVTENNDSNNTTQDGGNNNGGSNNDGNENDSENNGGNSNTEKPAEKITITFDLNGIDETLPTTVIETTSNKSVYLPILTNSKFSHWNTKADGSGLSYKDSAIFVESVTLYAILLAENAHKITYVLDGGVNNPQNSFSFTEDDYIGLKNPSKDGYKFLGWYDNKNFTGNAIKGWADGDKTADVTLYAKWEKEPEPAVKVTITFNVNKAGGTAPAAIETTSDKSVELPTLANAKFSHWNTKADGSGLSYKGSVIFAESVTLYAILLAENAYTITYELNGGVNHPKNKYSFTEDDDVILREPTRENCVFVGWYESPDFSGEKIELWCEGDKTADVTLYAKWIKGYKITYVLNGGVNSPYNPSFFTEEGYGYEVYLGKPTKDGYFFCGWYETEDFTDSSISYFYTSTNLRNITLYAKWGKLDDVITTTPVTVRYDSFPYGFRFTTEDGWECTYISTAAVSTGEQYNQVYAKLNGDTVDITTEPKDNGALRDLEDMSTKIYVDPAELAPNRLYTLIYDKKKGTVKVTEATTGAKATSTKHQYPDADGVFPAGMYISGYLGYNWAVDDNAGSALLMDVVDAANEVYAFTWAAPADTITVTLKITMEDTNSTLYLKDVPVKTDGTSEINGSIYGWNNGTAVVIKNEDNSAITGGIFDAAATATANAEWALTNYVNGNKDVDLAENFGMAGADDVLQLSIDAEKFVPYVKGQESVFSWNNAQDRLSYREPEIISISVNSTNHKTSYYTDNSLDLSNLTIKATKDDGTTGIVKVSSSMVSGFDSSVAGTQTLTITYGDCTATFDVEVIEE